MVIHRPVASRCLIGIHIALFLAAGYALASTYSDMLRLVLTVVSGTSLFVLTGLVHEASHYSLARRKWINDVMGNLSGAFLATPVSAYRALHMKHHQRTNCDDDPNKVLKSRWMILVGAPVYIALAHGYAWRHLRGRALLRYLAEMVGIGILATLVFFLPRPIREWSLMGPMIAVGVLQNLRIVTGHMDLPMGKYHDTWQLVLPGWLSFWLLHYDHHLEHHIRPRLKWYELPALRAKLARDPGLTLHEVTLPQFFWEVFLLGRLGPQPAPMAQREMEAGRVTS
jgi:fatty acid desaturase